ncbi:hypothetical protein HYH03_015425 [Edaphochlamys debaryana]|uniref:Pre-mRNA-splicing factor cwc2 n=1 Tax=Edaphochlamys debaryana TaxID=47281 RepID=A0A835XM47_9CHLO|nr:hypothetical protein HYH03_015425 [Edaphochlamys debaryana]|eukprot:KAG2485842.1 hypothetical protein HYH03_015425 [Edaphochlamys debaryana]
MHSGAAGPMNPRDPAWPNRPEWLTRPARRQVDDATLAREMQARGGPGERNLWSGRKQGSSANPPGGDRRGRDRELSKYRLVMEADVGRTRGSDAKQHMFCIYFCKGCCSQGSACPYLHRLPTAADEQYAVRDLSADIFGREKRSEQEGYRKGAGTLDRDNRTLFVNYEGAGSYDLPKVRQLLTASFGAYGPVNNIYIVHTKTIAFVRYDWRSSAEFAKEATHKQGLVGSTLGEVLTVRWASEDPNPVAVLAQKRACEEAFGQALMQSYEALAPEQKRARIQELQLASALRAGQVISNYPSTDAQFAQREAQQRQLEEDERARAAAEAAAAEEEDIPFIPPDIYEEQQRLMAAKQAQAQAQAAAKQAADALRADARAYGTGLPPPAAAGSAAAPAAGKQAAAASGGGAGGGAAALPPGPYGGGGSFGAGGFDEAAAAAAVAGGPVDVSQAPDWEKAWADPEIGEKMRADPELRDKLRRARSEHVYNAAYSAHVSAYTSSYGHHHGARAAEQEQAQQAQHVDAQQAAHDYAAWHAQYGGYDQYGQYVGYDPQYAAQYGYGYEQYGGAQGAGEAAAAGREGAGGEAGKGGAEGEGGEGGKGGQADGLSLLGAAYGTDSEGEEDG